MKHLLDAEALTRALTPLALDLRWAWSHAADHLWRRLDPELWEATSNPWIVLQSVGRRQLEILGSDRAFVEALETCCAEQQMARSSSSWFSRTHDGDLRLVAYFSMEFGLCEVLPIYAGGLGVLAGDHLKSASDLGVPIVGVGLLYADGYFRQVLDADGSQRELYPPNDAEFRVASLTDGRKVESGPRLEKRRSVRVAVKSQLLKRLSDRYGFPPTQKLRWAERGPW